MSDHFGALCIKRLNDYESDYTTLLKKTNTTTIEAKRLHTLATEILKTMNNINSNFMKDIFTPRSDPKVRPIEIFVKHHMSTKYDCRSLIALGLEIWNQIPSNVKSLRSITKFKEYIRILFGPSWKCNIWRML